MLGTTSDGGFEYERVGYWQDYCCFAVGLSEGRARWLIIWVEDREANPLILVREFVEVLGRWSYASRP